MSDLYWEGREMRPICTGRGEMCPICSGRGEWRVEARGRGGGGGGGKGRCLDAGPDLNAEGMRRPTSVGIHLTTRAARQTHEQGRRLKAKIDRDRGRAS